MDGLWQLLVLDRAALEAYGWGDLEVPGYAEGVGGWSGELLDRLHARNAELS